MDRREHVEMAVAFGVDVLRPGMQGLGQSGLSSSISCQFVALFSNHLELSSIPEYADGGISGLCASANSSPASSPLSSLPGAFIHPPSPGTTSTRLVSLGQNVTRGKSSVNEQINRWVEELEPWGKTSDEQKPALWASRPPSCPFWGRKAHSQAQAKVSTGFSFTGHNRRTDGVH